MPYTASQLTTFYTNANMGMTPSAAETLLIQAYAQQNTNGALSDAQTLSDVLSLSRDKTDVAVSTYEFFTGSTPTLAGLSYLVHGGGNANDLSSAYYANFNTENRYYNFAINLAFGGPNAASFASTYSNMTFDQAVASAYELIIGSANATAAGIDPAKAIASIEASLPYFQMVASERASTANQDLATKAIMIGYILEEAIKADVGTYAKSLDGFMGSLSTTGTATTGDLLTNYPATSAVTNVALTTGLDSVTGNNVNVSGTVGTGGTFGAGDSIKVTGATNTVSLSDLGGAAFSPTNIAGVTVSGVQTANFYGSGADAVTVNTTGAQGWTGLTQLNVTAGTGGTLAATGAATTNITATGGGAAVTVDGGNNVTATNSGASITVDGTTGSAGNVTVTNSGGAVTVGGAAAAPTGSITVTDKAQAGNAVAVDGGSSVTITTTGDNGGTITVGANTATTGAVNVTATTGTANGNTNGAIAITGGSAVTVTENAGAAAVGSTVNMGAVTVTGTSSTSSVTVNQAAAATASAAAAGVAGVVGVAGVTAAPGVNGVTAVTAVAPVSASAGTVGVTDAVVTIQDANYNSVKANTITSVSLANYGNSTIKDNALSSLALSGASGTLAITNATAGGAAPTSNSTLSLTLNGLSGADTITDTNAEIKTLNVTTGAVSSKLAAFTDANLTTLNVSGSSTLTLSAINGSLTALNVSGAAGFNDGNTGAGTGLAARGSALTITDTSSGTFTAALDDTKQSFTGSTGTDVITISDLADASSKISITAGSASNNELILDGGAYALTSATAAQVKGFQVLGVTAAVTGTIDMTTIDANASTLDIRGGATVNFTKVATGANVNLDATGATVNVQYVDANGVNDTTTVNLGTAATIAGFTTTSLTLQDANKVGIGTVNIVSNDAGAFNDKHTITTLVDNGLSHLNVSGTGGLTITTLNEATTQATSFTLNNTETNQAGVTIGTFTDANLGSLTFAGTNASTISALNVSGNVLSIANSGSSTATVGALSDAALTSLTLSGNVALGANAATASGAIGATTGVTVAGSSDNAHVNLNLTGAAAGATDSITLGNGNDLVTDGSTAGTVNVTVGTGYNLIDVHTGNAATYAANVTLGSHTDTATLFDEVKVSHTITGETVSAAITGTVKGDLLVFTDATATTIANASTAQQTTLSGEATLAAAITQAFAYDAVAHQAYAFQYGGNTYVVDSVAGTGAFVSGTDTVVELVGVHTIATNAAVGTIAVAS